MPQEVGVYIMLKGTVTEVEPEVVGWQSGGALKSFATQGLTKGHINGKIMRPKSALQLTNPVEFIIRTPEGTSATEYQLLKFDEKGNRREFRPLDRRNYSRLRRSRKECRRIHPGKDCQPHVANQAGRPEEGRIRIPSSRCVFLEHFFLGKDLHVWSDGVTTKWRTMSASIGECRFKPRQSWSPTRPEHCF